MLNSHQEHLDETNLPKSEVSNEVLNQQNKEVSEKFETEKNQLKEIIKQLEKDLAQQQLQYKEEITRLQETTNKKDEQIKNLQQEKTSYEQRSKELEKYLETTVKEQMKAYEAQIKTLQESQLKEKAKPSTALPVEAKKVETANVEAITIKIDEDYKRKLDQVVLKLDHEWAGWFEFNAKDNKLDIKCISYDSLTDQEVRQLSKDIIRILGENNLLDLFGLNLWLSECTKLTNKSLEYVATIVSNQSLQQLQSLALHFPYNPKMTDKGVEDITFDIKKHCKNLKELLISFFYCKKVTPEKKEELRKKFAHVPKLTIS